MRRSNIPFGLSDLRGCLTNECSLGFFFFNAQGTAKLIRWIGLMSCVAGRCEALCANCFSAIFSRETRFLSHPKVCSKIVLANNYSDLEVVELTPVYTYFEIYVIIVLS